MRKKRKSNSLKVITRCCKMSLAPFENIMKIASRALILHEKKILLVRHIGRDFYALPGGKVDEGEDVQTAIRRELKEELNRDAEVGNLLFVHEFQYPGGDMSVEFFFHITNGSDFVGELDGTHGEKELAEITWLPMEELQNIKPAFLIEKIPKLSLDGKAEFISFFR